VRSIPREKLQPEAKLGYAPLRIVIPYAKLAKKKPFAAFL
jgi:hypothetical protein